ncbi:glycoside hydrolase family 93 protein [Patellaria atrata CBS 101060]|uniref:Glycoside hydrolase family 93 protein n=1 Tax=Patellaria atrata CBS 101060 TaxID=1346257 RepID=A0A9P4SJ95_9PEZI|nr:glycoside hydrolase family 93 protein [Patellaria atrata CBS 101060]
MLGKHITFFFVVLFEVVFAATIFKPPSNYKVPRTLYARTLLLNQTDNAILATWENYSPEPPYFPVYQSKDLGKTWTELSRVTDQVNGWGLRYQPHLYELPVQMGNFSAGTLLMAGSSIPEDLAITQIDLYTSTDRGRTWTFVSHIARGGRGLPNNGETPVWEPFLMEYKGKMIVYYSDQRDRSAGQKMVHQVSSDLINWDTPVDDVKYSTYSLRPGMPVVALLPNGQYIYVYEYGGSPIKSFGIYYRMSADPLNFRAAPEQVLRATDGTIPTSSPYVVWTPAGGSSGTIVVSANSHSEVFINKNLGAVNSWVKMATPSSRSYTRSLLTLPSKNDILIVGAGVLNGNNNAVTAETIRV